MNVLNTVNDVSVRSGGVVSALGAIILCKDFVSLVMCSDRHSDALAGINVVYTRNKGVSPFRFIFGLTKDLDSIKDIDVIHTHGMWLHINSGSVMYALRQRIPCVISPHGMLYPEAFQSKPIRKKLIWKFLFKPIFDKSSCIHVTCERELIVLRDLGVKSPIALIPNAVVSYNIRSNNEIIEALSRRRIGFLGRIDKRKRIDLLIDIWIDFSINGTLIIAGEGDPAYYDFLRRKACGYENIFFVGFLSGSAKVKFLKSLCALVVPSDFENFGMIIPEALSVGTPVIASSGTPWEILERSHSGWWIDNNSEDLSRAIIAALDQSESQIIRRSHNAFTLCNDRFSSMKINDMYLKLYQWLRFGGDKPDFIDFY